MPSDWKVYAFMCIGVLIIMIGLIAIARMLRGRVKMSKGSLEIGEDHTCTKGPLFERIVTSLDLIMSGQVVQLDWILKQGANGNTKDTRDKIADNANAWLEFLIKKGVRE
jgi:hypothetical protein